MRLATRMGLLGALVPAALIAVAFVVVGQVLGWMLVRAVDRGMTGEALIESVSLFDLGDGAPHLHLDRSPLVGQLGGSATARAVYGPTGGRLLVWPATAALPSEANTAGWPTHPSISHEYIAGEAVRVLRMRVASPTGAPHGLLIAHSLKDVETTLRRYHQIAAVVTVLAVLILLVVQRWQSTWLMARFERLSAHMSRLASGQLGDDPPPDQVGDELTSLRDAIAAATAQLRAARTARDRLIADAAHELRTPLTAIRLEIDLALRRERPRTELVDTLSRLREESERLTRMTHQLLDLAALRGSPLPRAPVELRAELQAALDRAALLATEANVHISLAPGQAATIQGSADELSRVFDNLLANAIRFAARGERDHTAAEAGAVRITLESARSHSISSSGGRAMVLIRMEDDGPGIGEGDPEALFAPFHRRDRSTPGTGLGLAIVADIIRRHAGFVGFQRDRSAGACVEVRLPIAEQT